MKTASTPSPKTGLISDQFPDCPFRNILSWIGDKWSMLILYTINSSDAPLRFNELEKSIPDISSRVLSSCLRDMEADDLVSRKIYPCVPPKVEYSLTETGASLMPHILALGSWAKEHMEHITGHRVKYAKRKEKNQ